MPLLRTAAVLVAACRLVSPAADPPGPIDNSSLLPPIRPDAEVRMTGNSPDWIRSLAIVQLRIETATADGTFASAVPVLDHYARLGVNGLWINPIFERGSKSNGYQNFGPHTIELLLTGTRDTDKSFSEVRRFVDEAHRRDIRVFLDIVVWGCAKEAPLVRERPEFFRRDGEGFAEVWGGYAFDWSHVGFRDWFEDAAVALIERTGADGFRVDLAPDTSGDFFGRVRRRLYDAGRRIAVISELPNADRSVFDFEQIGVTGWTEEPAWHDPDRLRQQRDRFGRPFEFFLNHNLVDAIRSGRGIGSATLQQRGEGGKFRYYTASLLCHDDTDPAARGSRVPFAYGMLFAPFLPIWWIGEEWNNPKRPLPDPRGTGVMYFNTIDWNAAAEPENAAFLEDIKAYLRIRRSYPSVFEYFPPHTTDANIAKVTSRLDGAPNPLQAYARYRNNLAVLVVPNSGTDPARFEIDVDLPAWELAATDTATVRVTDLLSHAILFAGPAAGLQSLAAPLPADRLALLLVQLQP